MTAAARSSRHLAPTAIAVAGWALVALASAAQGVVFSSAGATPQPWWPTLGYTAAIFSIWALLTPLLLAGADRVAATSLRWQRIGLYLLGLPLAAGLHLALFVILYGPIYGGDAAGPVAMARAVMLSNLDSTAFAYAALLAAAHLRRRGAGAASGMSAAPPAAEGLWIRSRGIARLVRFDEIDWIGAAGDYAEVHAGGAALLTDRSLAKLADTLPANEFARIHRGAIVRLDRVREVRSVGRGDAEVRLRDGERLRMSRRYRGQLGGALPV